MTIELKCVTCVLEELRRGGRPPKGDMSESVFAARPAHVVHNGKSLCPTHFKEELAR